MFLISRICLLFWAACTVLAQSDDSYLAAVTTLSGGAFRDLQQGAAVQQSAATVTSDASTATASILPDPPANDTQSIELTPQNDLALSILSKQTTNNTGNATIDELVNQGRGLLADLSHATAEQLQHDNINFAWCFDDDRQTVVDIYKAV